MSKNETAVVSNRDNPDQTVVSPVGKWPDRSRGLFSAQMAADLYCLIEITLVFLCGLVSAKIYVGNVLKTPDYFQIYIWPMLILPLTMGLILYRSEVYTVGAIANFTTNLGKVVAGLFGAFFTTALVGVVVSVTEIYSRVWFGSWLVLSAIVLWLSRAIAVRVFSIWATNGGQIKTAAVYGWGPPVEELMNKIGDPGNYLSVAGVFGPNSEQQCSGRYKFAGSLEHMLTAIQETPPDLVIIALPADAHLELAEAIDKLCVYPGEIKLLPPFGSAHIPLRGISSHGTAHFVDLQLKPVSDWNRLAKMLEDYAISLVSLVLLAPLFLIVAVAIKLESRGPVFFLQPRNGLNNAIFNVYKFRTMQWVADGENFRQTLPNDSRVTRIGRFLRRSSMDELPQLLNVLRGEMSIVGPRPHPVELNTWHVGLLPLYNKRHSMKPGITGWAQIHDHRGPTRTTQDMRNRLEFDLYYIDNWSIWMDFSIIATTPLLSVIHKNAV